MKKGLLIGAGQVALEGHLPAYIQDSFLSREVQIVAAVDHCEENLRACESMLPGIHVYREISQAFINEDVDFVDICTPPHVRLSVIQEAAARGWHILCEKPIATNLHSGLEIQRVLARRRIMFMPCHQYPFSPLWRTVLQQVKDGLIGEVRLAAIEAYRERADPGSRHWRKGWRQRRDIAGGGILLDIGTHYLHLVHLLFGLPISVTARLASLSGQEHDVEDTAVVILDYPAGPVELHLSWAAVKRETRLRIDGTAGSILFDGTTLRVDCGVRQQHWTLSDAMSKSCYFTWYAQLFRRFFDAIGHRLSKQPLVDAITTLRYIEAAYASARQNDTVTLSRRK